MQETPIPCKHIPFTRGRFISGAMLLFIFLFSGCATLAPYTEKKPLSDKEVQDIAAEIAAQGEAVSGFYFTGTLSMNRWILDRSANIFVAAKKSPFRLKMEISHSWGKPLFYLLIRDNELEAIDFMEKREYTGEFSPENLSLFLPGMDLSHETIWSFLRGYPWYPAAPVIYEETGGVLRLKGENKVLVTITLSREREIKAAASPVSASASTVFRGFNLAGDISYAEETLLRDQEKRSEMTLKRKRVVFNKEIPEDIFTLENQPNFEIINLDEAN